MRKIIHKLLCLLGLHEMSQYYSWEYNNTTYLSSKCKYCEHKEESSYFYWTSSKNTLSQRLDNIT